MNEEYKNLTKDELVFADHFAETGNWTALKEMQKVSASRDTVPGRPIVIDRRDKNE